MVAKIYIRAQCVPSKVALQVVRFRGIAVNADPRQTAIRVDGNPDVGNWHISIDDTAARPIKDMLGIGSHPGPWKEGEPLDSATAILLVGGCLAYSSVVLRGVGRGAASLDRNTFWEVAPEVSGVQYDPAYAQMGLPAQFQDGPIHEVGVHKSRLGILGPDGRTVRMTGGFPSIAHILAVGWLNEIRGDAIMLVGASQSSTSEIRG